MDDGNNRTYGIEKLVELLIERGIEFSVTDEVSLVFKDGLGNLHECWMAGADENRVNALIVVTPEQLLSVSDLNGIIDENERLTKQCERLFGKMFEMADENARLKELVRDMYRDMCGAYVGGRPLEPYQYDGRMRERGIEVDDINQSDFQSTKDLVD